MQFYNINHLIKFQKYYKINRQIKKIWIKIFSFNYLFYTNNI